MTERQPAHCISTKITITATEKGDGNGFDPTSLPPAIVKFDYMPLSVCIITDARQQFIDVLQNTEYQVEDCGDFIKITTEKDDGEIDMANLGKYVKDIGCDITIWYESYVIRALVGASSNSMTFDNVQFVYEEVDIEPDVAMKHTVPISPI